MKLVCEYFILCERVIEDAHTHTLTAVALLEQVNSLVFPSLHHGFGCAARLRVDGTPPTKATAVQYRVARVSEHEPEELVAEIEGQWTAGSRSARVVANFQTLRLKRQETLAFRLDHRVGRGRWVTGPVATLDIMRMALTPDQRKHLLDELSARGLPAPDLG